MGEDFDAVVGVKLKRARCLEHNAHFSLSFSQNNRCRHSILRNVPVLPPIHQGRFLTDPDPCYSRILSLLAIRPDV